MKKHRSTLRGKQHGGRGGQRQDYGVIEAENKREIRSVSVSQNERRPITPSDGR